jgi:hypothetical protein
MRACDASPAVRVLAPFFALLALVGCGSVAPAQLPAPASAPKSPPMTTAPAGEVMDGRELITDTVSRDGVSYTIDRDRDLIERTVGAATRSHTTCREPVALALLSRGARIAVLCGRERVLDVYDATTLQRLGRTGAGIGPTDLATDGVDLLYVTDTLGEALLVFHLRPFELIRRVHLGGGPYAIAYDRARWGLWIALPGANRLVNYAAGNRPVLRESLPSIRDAQAVSVDADAVTVFGQDQRQVLRVRTK